MSNARPKITKEILDEEYVENSLKTQCLSSALYDITKNSASFYGMLLQSLSINYSHMLPTAGVKFDTDDKKWEMYINPFFFCKKLSADNRKAVLLHEILHIVHRHPIRVPFLKISERKRQLLNIAADMSINQYIKGLPKGCSMCPPVETNQPCHNPLCPSRCIDVKDFYDQSENGKKTPWKELQSMEFYYEKLLTRFDDPDESNSSGNEEGKSENVGEGNAGGGANTKDLPATLDEHMWDGSADEVDMLDATEELVKRTMVKSRFDFSDLPGAVQELLKDIRARRAELNYKALIMHALKRHAAGHDRKHTWARKSKRFGNLAPGTKVGDLPRLYNFIDTSGSISVEEANEFLSIVDQFLRVGARRCDLGFFHTSLYKTESYKTGTRINKEDIQSGGTDLEPVMREILKRKPDLSVILTDGYYGDVPVEQWMKPGEKFPVTLFIISKNGEEDHPLKRLGAQTVKIPNPDQKG